MKDRESLKKAVRRSAPPRRESLAMEELPWAWDIIRAVNTLRRTDDITLPMLAEATGYTVDHLQPSLSGRRMPGRGLMTALEKWLKEYNKEHSGGDDGTDEKYSVIASEAGQYLSALLGGKAE